MPKMWQQILAYSTIIVNAFNSSENPFSWRRQALLSICKASSTQLLKRSLTSWINATTNTNDQEHQHIQKWLKGKKAKGKFQEMFRHRDKEYLPNFQKIYNFLRSSSKQINTPYLKTYL
jgi:hypothetical protein